MKLMPFLKVYFKTRGLRQIIQWLIIAGVSIIFLTAFAVADAYASADSCPSANSANIEGITTVLGAPSSSGTLDFNDAPTPGFVNYRARICPLASVTDEYLNIQGWVWDANLGWISLYCKNGLNSGLPCSSGTPVNYGVRISKGTGDMSGWAWGDNIGWISFGCPGGTGAKNDGFACGSQKYSGNAVITVEKLLGNITGWAWADTVGWFKLNGAYGLILPLVVPQSTVETKIGVWTKVENDTQTGTNRNLEPNKKTAPAADGTQGYDFFIHVADMNGNPLVDGGAIKVNFFTSMKDTVPFDQTSATASDFHDNNNGPTSKPGIGTNVFTPPPGPLTSGGVANSYYGKLTSYAPTSNMNCIDETGDGVCDFYYKDSSPVPIPDHTLSYEGANVTVILSHGLPIGDEVLNFPLLPSLTTKNTAFNPNIELTTFNKLFDPSKFSIFINYMLSFRNVVDYFDIQGGIKGKPPAAGYSTMLYTDTTLSTDPTVDYRWIKSTEDDITEGEKEIKYGGMPSPNPMMAIPFSSNETLAPLIQGLKVYSKVAYKTPPGPTVQYYSNGLPRIPFSKIANQAAVFEGPVYSPGGKQVSSDVKVTPLGNLYTNDLRNKIYKNVSGLIGGLNENSNEKIIDLHGKEITFSTSNEYTKLGGGNTIYVKNGNLVLDSFDKFAGTKDPITFIVEGGDIFVKPNINAPSPLGPDPGVPVALIALENPDTDAADQLRIGGRIYAHSSVTDWIHTFIFADGPVYRYHTGICYFTDKYDSGLVGKREPNFVQSGRCDTADPGSYVNAQMVLKNQFSFLGTWSSQNTIGGSANPSKLIRGDNLPLKSSTATSLAIAMLYDLNYFTYYTEIPPGGTFSGAASLSLTAAETGPAYFKYEPVPEKLLGFNRL